MDIYLWTNFVYLQDNDFNGISVYREDVANLTREQLHSSGTHMCALLCALLILRHSSTIALAFPFSRATPIHPLRSSLLFWQCIAHRARFILQTVFVELYATDSDDVCWDDVECDMYIYIYIYVLYVPLHANFMVYNFYCLCSHGSNHKNFDMCGDLTL